MGLEFEEDINKNEKVKAILNVHKFFENYKLVE